jgi:hypothetical protein
MKNLDQIINKVSSKNSKSTSKYLNANDSLVEILYKKNQKLTRSEIIKQMLKMRILVDYDSEDNFYKEVPNEQEQDQIVEKMWKTCKNGIDTSISNSQNNSSFSYNDKYSDLKLELKNGKYQITKIENKK